MRLGGSELPRNLYRDLRDRRLLSISLALIVAIIAVPILLGGGGSTTATPAQADPGAPMKYASVIDPVVQTADPGLRSFYQRLGRIRSRNPFQQQLDKVPAAGGGAGGGGGSSSGTVPTQSSTTATSTTGGSSSAAGADTTTTTTTTSPSTSAPAPPSTTPDPGAAAPADPAPAPAEPSKPGHGGNGNGGAKAGGGDKSGGNAGAGGGDHGGGKRPASYWLDVRTGPYGKASLLHGVRPLRMLPDRDHPVAQYVDGASDGKTASFILSDDVGAVDGGRCNPSPAHCRVLVLEVGDDATLSYRPDELRYKLQLLAIRRHVEPLRLADDAAASAAAAFFDGPTAGR